MCRDCWADHGQPTELPPDGQRAIDLIKELYNTPGGEAGGPLHVQLDDWNIGDNWTLYANPDHSPELIAIADQVAFHMRQWTEEQQAAVLAVADGYHNPDAPTEQEGGETPPERHS